VATRTSQSALRIALGARGWGAGCGCQDIDPIRKVFQLLFWFVEDHTSVGARKEHHLHRGAVWCAGAQLSLLHASVQDMISHTIPETLSIDSCEASPFSEDEAPDQHTHWQRAVCALRHARQGLSCGLYTSHIGLLEEDLAQAADLARAASATQHQPRGLNELLATELRLCVPRMCHRTQRCSCMMSEAWRFKTCPAHAS
jgi:hypothetical protein